MKKRIIQGVGVFDGGYKISRSMIVNGKSKIVWLCPFYKKWSSMLERCYADHSHKKRPKYKECSVCDDWLLFSNFKKWMECQPWKDKELDKDLISNDNKIYSPTGCTFVSSEVNTFLCLSNSSRGSFPIGVSFDKESEKYSSNINLKTRNKKLGRFQTPMLAHQAWQKKKLELAIELQSRQDDDRVRKGLQRVIDKLDFHIKNGIETVSL